MIIKSFFYLTTTAVVMAGGYVVLQKAAPDAAAKISGLMYEHVVGWNKDTCESNPAGCLQNRFETLQGLEKQVEQSIRTVREQKERISTLVDEQQMLVAKNSSFLSDGKGLFKANELTPANSIEFAGKTYPNSASFKQQLALLFQEKTGLEANLKDATALRQKLSDRLDSLMVQSGNITLAKRLIPAQIELVKANSTLANFGDNVDMINGVISGSEAGLRETERLMRTTKDLIMPTDVNPARAHVSDKAFDEFMSH